MKPKTSRRRRIFRDYVVGITLMVAFIAFISGSVYVLDMTWRAIKNCASSE